jgi:hypothetical protein
VSEPQRSGKVGNLEHVCRHPHRLVHVLVLVHVLEVMDDEDIDIIVLAKGRTI